MLEKCARLIQLYANPNKVLSYKVLAIYQSSDFIMEQEEGIIYDWLNCTCLAIPQFEILWGNGKYIIFLPDYLIELYFPFTISGDIWEIDYIMNGCI